jgi:hypothetical protein
MTKKEVIKKVASQSFAEEIENDKKKTEMFLKRAQQAEEKLGVDHEVTKQEKAASGVYKRALMLIGSSDLNLNLADGSVKKASENNLPVATMLSHGGRILVEIPNGSDDSLMNWLTSGDKSIDGKSQNQTQKGAINEGKIVYNRPAATHAVAYENGKMVEKKGFLIGANDYVQNKVFGKKTQHYGVDLAMNAEFGGKDSEGNIVNKPDGHHGHLYIYYEPATKDKPGALLIGNEGAAPNSPKHSKVGASDPVSAIDGSKMDDLNLKLSFANEVLYQDTKIPMKYNGMTAKLTLNNIEAITNLKDNDFGYDVGNTIPAKNSKEFEANAKGVIDNFELKKKQHESPTIEYTRQKDQKIPTKKPKLIEVKKVIHKITFGKLFKKDIQQYKQYKAEKKADKVHNAISSKDKERIAKDMVKNKNHRSLENIKNKLLTKSKADIDKLIGKLKSHQTEYTIKTKQIIDKKTDIVRKNIDSKNKIAKMRKELSKTQSTGAKASMPHKRPQSNNLGRA